MLASTVVRESRSQAAARSIGCLAFIAACVWMLTSSRLAALPASKVNIVVAIGWLGSIFFGVLLLRYLLAVARPGTLTISPNGLKQDLGWRKKSWQWSDIDRAEIVRTAANRVSVCMIYPALERPVRLFGWEMAADELCGMINQNRLGSPSS